MPASSSRQVKQFKELVCVEIQPLMLIPSVTVSFCHRYHPAVFSLKAPVVSCTPSSSRCSAARGGAAAHIHSEVHLNMTDVEKKKKKVVVHAQTSETPSCNPLLTLHHLHLLFHLVWAVGSNVFGWPCRTEVNYLSMSKVLSDCQALLLEIWKMEGAEWLQKLQYENKDRLNGGKKE